MRVTALQIPVTNDPQANLDVILEQIRLHPETDWFLTPEAALSGYFVTPDPEFIDTAIAEITQLIDDTNQGLVLGTAYIDNGVCYNQQRVYGGKNLLGVYNKQLLTHNQGWLGETEFYTQGSKHLVHPIGPARGGFLICNDAWAYPPVTPDGDPYLWDELVNLGADMIFVSANCNSDEYSEIIHDWHVTHLRMISQLRGVFVIVANPTTTMWGTPVEHSQCPTAIITPDGEVYGWCAPGETDSVSIDV